MCAAKVEIVKVLVNYSDERDRGGGAVLIGNADTFTAASLRYAPLGEMICPARLSPAVTTSQVGCLPGVASAISLLGPKIRLISVRLAFQVSVLREVRGARFRDDTNLTCHKLH